MKPPNIVTVHFLSTKWSKKLFTINHYELQNGKCIVTQELSAYLFLIGGMEDLNFNYCYKITYESGETYDRRRNELSVEISKEDYKKIITGVLQERPIEQIEGISDVIDKMTENVEFADRFMNKNGSLRKTPLKKKRAISKLEFFIPEYEYRRLKKMKDPIETLERPVEHMTVYRNDGSSVTLTAENGRVSIVDSREKNVRHIIEADYFVSKIL